jgi:hypothetical protein
VKTPLLPFEVEVVPDDAAVTARAGLTLVVETERALGVGTSVRQHVAVRERDSGYREADKVEAISLLIASGGQCLDDIGVLQSDAGLLRLLDRDSLPSANALRNFLYAFHDEALIEKAQQERPEGQVAYIPEENGPLRGLGQVNVDVVRRIDALRPVTQATLDHDATIIESHKQQARAHYDDGRGYQPSMIAWAEQDLIVADEWRDGNVPAAMANLPTIQRGFAALPPTVTERYFRADSACYEERVLKWLADPARPDGPAGTIGFTISADMTPQLRAVCEAVPATQWVLLEERAREIVSACEVEFTPGNWPKDAWPLRYLALRFEKRQRDLFTAQTVDKYLAVVTNREGAVADLIRWHWEKAGTIEHVHDVMKNELAAGVPPCGRFGANAAWHRLNVLTYNVLSGMKSHVLPPPYSTARPKRLRHGVFTLAGRLVSHAGKLLLRVGQAAEQVAGLLAAREKIGAMHARLSPA